MNPGDWLILGVCGLVGFAIVWGGFALVRQQKAPPVPMLDVRAPPAGAPSLSVAELADRWHAILQVPPNASAADIERAYHERLSECDRARFASDAHDGDKVQAEARRAQISQAYEFIRPLR